MLTGDMTPDTPVSAGATCNNKGMLNRAALLDQVVTRWECPNCDVTDVTRGPVPNRYHTCAGLHMLTAPLVPAGARCKVEAEERQDYLAGDTQAAGDDGKPYMAVRTTYDDHDDLAVNAGLATARLTG